MSINNFIPTIWSAQILSSLDNELVYANLCNRDYEGEISAYGDTVKINSLGDVTVGDYVKNTDIDPAETLTDAQRELKIDQAKYFNFQIDDIDKAQQKPKVMQEATQKAAYALAEKTDRHIAGLYTDIAVANQIGDDTTPIVVDSTKTTGVAGAYESLVKLAVKLTEANVPRSGRWAVVPPWYHGLLLTDDRFVGAGTAKTDSVLANGYIGRAAGFDLYESNNVPETAGEKYKVIGGHSMAWSYAEQILDVDAYRPEKRFADALKGLHVYGSKVVRPTALALLTCNPAD